MVRSDGSVGRRRCDGQDASHERDRRAVVTGLRVVNAQAGPPPTPRCELLLAWCHGGMEDPDVPLGRLIVELANDPDPEVRRYLAWVFFYAFMDYGADPHEPMLDLCTHAELAAAQTAMLGGCPLDPGSEMYVLGTVPHTAELLARRGELDDLVVGYTERECAGAARSLPVMLSVLPQFASHLTESALRRIIELVSQHPDREIEWFLDRALSELATRRDACDPPSPGAEAPIDLRSTEPRPRTGPGVELAGCDGRGVDWSGRDLREANLTGADLRGADLRGADLSGALLYAANLAGANLDRARLDGAICSGTDLRRASLFAVDATNASLVAADLRGANLTAARLRGANLRDADCRGTRIDGLDLSACACAGARFDE
jgi:hypothetical protein